MNYEKRMLDKNAIGEKIRFAMIDNHITYEDLSWYLNLTSPRVIYDWVNGKKLPKLENFVNLCLLFNIKFEDFVVFL